jgi:hypothetical protein
MRYVVNSITISRIVSALFLLPIKTFSIPFYALYIFCGLTDMADGYIARKTHVESEFGSKLDSIADTVFVIVCLFKILPNVEVKLWMWIWIVAIAFVKVMNIISGYVCKKKLIMLHTIANKVSGLLCFILPLAIWFVNINYAAIFVCSVATFAAVQEGYFIRKEDNYK